MPFPPMLFLAVPSKNSGATLFPQKMVTQCRFLGKHWCNAVPSKNTDATPFHQ
jgi:hypothetical protein